jgi:S1-C subfamily serine protease
VRATVNGLDVVMVGLALGAAAGGYRLGFVTRVVSWIGSVIGLVVALRILPSVLERLQGGDPLWLLFVSLAVVLAGLTIGQSIGFAVGARVRPVQDRVAWLDRVAGAGAGVVGVLVVLWLLMPVLTEVPGPVAEQVRRSRVAQELDRVTPAAPDSMQTLRAFIGEDRFPQVFDALRPTPDLGPPPPATGLTTATVVTVARSVVKVEGIACNRVQDGTGFVIDEELVVTNAHVVAGQRETEVMRDDSSRAPATVVAFDADRDLAVLRVPGLARPPLPLGESSLEATGGVFGHPGGGPLRIAPFAVANRLQATGRDIYGTRLTTRDILELRSELRPGDSGSALVDQAGTVVGVAFAIAPDRSDVAYALSTTELREVLASPLSEPVGSGRCTTR